MEHGSFFWLALATATLGATLADAQTTPGQAAAATGAESTVGEVVVTAQRRAEVNTKVPIAISFASGETLRKSRIDEVSDLQQIVPGFSMGFSGANTQPTIRGVGTQDAGPGAPANVATYIDGFYQPNEITANVELSDVTSVQVLKGPQGTLYGRNATGGAILITTRSPSFTPGADFSASYGNENNSRLTLFATGPITDTLAGSISLLSDMGDGYLHNVVTDKTESSHQNYDIRAKLLYKPTDRLSFELSYVNLTTHDPNENGWSVYKGESDAVLFVPGAIADPGAYQTSTSYPPQFLSRSNMYSLKSTLDLNFATLTSYTSASWQRNNSTIEFDGSSAALLTVNFPSKDKTFQQEFDLASNTDGRLQWTTGLFLYYNEEVTYVNFEQPFTVYDSARQKDKSLAVFGEATYELTPKLFLTAGLRYSYDHLYEEYQTALTIPPFLPGQNATSFDAVTPRVNLRYDLTKRQSLYVSFNEGYKSGLFNPQGLSTTPVQPETIKAYEIGYKASTPDWSLSTAAYYYDYTNLQVTSIHGADTELTNAASARIYGAEAQLSRRLVEGLTADVGLSYVHARYVSFKDAPNYAWIPGTPGAPGPGVVNSPGDASGNPIVNSPDFSAQVGLNYERPVQYGSIQLHANYAYFTTRYFDSFKVLSQGPYGLLNLRASWYAPDKRWGVHVFAKNLTNQVYVTAIQQLPLAFLDLYGPPRTYGVELTIHL